MWWWCWRRLLRVPWTAKRSNQSILKEINPEYSLEGLMLKLQYFVHLMQRTVSLEKTLMLGKIDHGGRRGQEVVKDFRKEKETVFLENLMQRFHVEIKQDVLKTVNCDRNNEE